MCLKLSISPPRRWGRWVKYFFTCRWPRLNRLSHLTGQEGRHLKRISALRAPTTATYKPLYTSYHLLLQIAWFLFAFHPSAEGKKVTLRSWRRWISLAAVAYIPMSESHTLLIALSRLAIGGCWTTYLSRMPDRTGPQGQRQSLSYEIPISITSESKKNMSCSHIFCGILRIITLNCNWDYLHWIWTLTYYIGALLFYRVPLHRISVVPQIGQLWMPSVLHHTKFPGRKQIGFKGVVRPIFCQNNSKSPE